MVKKVFRVVDMHCGNCAMRLEALEDDLPGVKRVHASYHKGEMVVEFDDKLLTEAQIIAEVKKLGYTAKVT